MGLERPYDKPFLHATNTPSPECTFNATGSAHTANYYSSSLILLRDCSGQRELPDVPLRRTSRDTYADYSKFMQKQRLSRVHAAGRIHRLFSLDPSKSSYSHWTQYTMPIPEGFSGTENYIIFRGVMEGGYSIFIDDVDITSFEPNLNLPVPVLTTPANNEVNVQLKPRFEWELLPFYGDANAYSYNIRIVNTSTYEVVQDTVVDNIARLDQALESGQTYLWKVRTVQSGSAGAWSGDFVFSTINYCESNSYMCSDYTQHITSVRFASIENLRTQCSRRATDIPTTLQFQPSSQQAERRFVSRDCKRSSARQMRCMV
jgi:hypothetical protein